MDTTYIDPPLAGTKSWKQISFIYRIMSRFCHIFILSLSLYGYVKIQNCIRKADLKSKYSPRDLIEQFRKVYMLDLDCQMILTEVSERIGEIEKKLNLKLFPK
jgi:hypothetical protein